MDGIIAAFRKSGVGRHGGHLVLKVNNGRLFPHVVEQLAKECSGTDVTIINETWSRQKVNALIACCDVSFPYIGPRASVCPSQSDVSWETGDRDGLFREYGLHSSRTRPCWWIIPCCRGRRCRAIRANSRWAEPDTDKAAEWMDRVQRDGVWRARIAQSGQSYIASTSVPP